LKTFLVELLSEFNKLYLQLDQNEKTPSKQQISSTSPSPFQSVKGFHSLFNLKFDELIELFKQNFFLISEPDSKFSSKIGLLQSSSILQSFIKNKITQSKVIFSLFVNKNSSDFLSINEFLNSLLSITNDYILSIFGESNTTTESLLHFLYKHYKDYLNAKDVLIQHLKHIALLFLQILIIIHLFQNCLIKLILFYQQFLKMSKKFIIQLYLKRRKKKQMKK
jgi:hypothetical protein